MSIMQYVTLSASVPFKDDSSAAIRVASRADLPHPERTVKNGQYAR
jgi:hypothetical protein